MGRAHPDPSDGRSTLATLTTEGLAVDAEAAPAHAARVRELVLAPLPPPNAGSCARSAGASRSRFAGSRGGGRSRARAPPGRRRRRQQRRPRRGRRLHRPHRRRPPMELIFVHGALVRDGDWWWQPAADLLERAPASAAAPSPCRRAARRTPEQVAGGLVADAAALRRALDEVDEAIVVGHSYGGTVIAEAGAHHRCSHPALRLVVPARHRPGAGRDHERRARPGSIGDNGDGTLSVAGYDAASFGARFLQDADDDGPARGLGPGDGVRPPRPS